MQATKASAIPSPVYRNQCNLQLNMATASSCSKCTSVSSSPALCRLGKTRRRHRRADLETTVLAVLDLAMEEAAATALLSPPALRRGLRAPALNTCWARDRLTRCGGRESWRASKKLLSRARNQIRVRRLHPVQRPSGRRVRLGARALAVVWRDDESTVSWPDGGVFCKYQKIETM